MNLPLPTFSFMCGDWRTYCGAIAVLLVLLLGLVVLAWTFFPRLPTEAAFDEFFFERKDGFAVLRRMLESESADIVGVTQKDVMLKHTWQRVSPSEAGMPEERFGEYKRIMTDNSVRQVWRQGGEVSIAAGFSGWGFGSKGPRLAYVYREQPPDRQETSFDSERQPGAGWRTVYRRLSDDWYVRTTW